MPAPPRAREQRRREAEEILTAAADLWVASASADGVPYLLPLSHHWDGDTVLLSTAAATRTARNLAANPTVRLAVGHTRDLCLIDGSVEVLAMADVSVDRGDAFAAQAGFDPRPLSSPYVWLRVTPQRIQAWREENEIEGRDLMVGGSWLDDEGVHEHAG